MTGYPSMNLESVHMGMNPAGTVPGFFYRDVMGSVHMGMNPAPMVPGF